ncbi:MAG: ABC transporter ATP-binding protein [Gaiellales bacterium]
MSEPAVELRDLRKHYGDLVAVDGVDLRVEQGDVYGYLGPNGAGKTTSLRMMLGLVQPTSGEVRLLGRDPMIDPVAALEGVAGFVEEPAFYPYLSGRKNLELLAALDGGAPPERLAEVLEIVELTARAGDRVRGYSHGMRQRLGIAAALLRAPRLLMLDEPTTGLDPAGMRDMRELVRTLAGQGITILLSSHLMLEVEHLCNRVAIIHRGRIRYEGALSDLLDQGGERYRLAAAEPARAAELCRAAAGIHDISVDNGDIRFAADHKAVSALTVEIGRAGIGIHSLVPAGRGLEDIYFELTEPAERAS